MKRADAILVQFIRNLGLEDGVRLARLKKEWSEIFERPVSFHMSPATLKKGELLIHVDSPIWLQQLSFYKAEIIKKLYSFGIKTVRFKLGRVLPEKKQEKAISKKQLTSDEHSYIKETVSSVSDQKLRDQIQKAIEKSITFSHR